MPESIAIVFALREELKPLLKECRVESRTLKKPGVLTRAHFLGVPLLLCQTGTGMANAHEGAELLVEHAKPSLILSVGCAGATQPDLRPGDVIMADEIRSETPADRFGTSSKARDELEMLIREERLSYRKGPLTTLWKIAGRSAKEKAGSKGAMAVDMETAAVAAVAEKARIPFVSLRVIFDPMEEDLPFTEPFDEAHPFTFLFKNPKAILKIPKYMRMNQVCQRNLCRVLARFIDCYGC